jgi:hypothetical protein
VPYNKTVAEYLTSLHSRLSDECGLDWTMTDVGRILVEDMIEYAADIDHLAPEDDSDTADA